MIGFLSSWRISPTAILIKNIVIQAGIGADFRNPRFCHIVASPRVWHFFRMAAIHPTC
jgi:hypothetical protein